MMAAIIAAVGLATNSSVSTVASMLISPMMGPILAITFGMAIKTRVLQRVARKELRANLVGRPGDENLSPPYQGPIIPGDSKHGIVILPRKKRPGTTQSRRRLAKVHSILYETGRQEDDQAEALSEKHEEARRNTIFVVQLMNEKHEWATEWHDDAVEELVETSGKWTRPDGKPMERVSAANAEKKLQPLQPGEKVPYLDHNAQVDADKGRPTVEEVRARYTTPAEQDDAILGNTIEEEAMYEVKWNPAEILDRDAYQESLAEVERGEKDEKGNLKVLRVEANKEVTFKTKDSSLAKWYLMRKGAWSEAVAALVAWLMGFAVSPLFMVLTRWEHFSGTFWGWPPLTDEMVGRGDYYNFFVRPPSLRPCSTALRRCVCTGWNSLRPGLRRGRRQRRLQRRHERPGRRGDLRLASAASCQQRDVRSLRAARARVGASCRVAVGRRALPLHRSGVLRRGGRAAVGGGWHHRPWLPPEAAGARSDLLRALPDEHHRHPPRLLVRQPYTTVSRQAAASPNQLALRQGNLPAQESGVP